MLIPSAICQDCYRSYSIQYIVIVARSFPSRSSDIISVSNHIITQYMYNIILHTTTYNHAKVVSMYQYRQWCRQFVYVATTTVTAITSASQSTLPIAYYHEDQKSTTLLWKIHHSIIACNIQECIYTYHTTAHSTNTIHQVWSKGITITNINHYYSIIATAIVMNYQ